jgi:ribonucleoside-diphosphate reductase alpha chain
VAEKYFRHVEQEDGSKIRETSVRSMISRVAGTIANWGIQLDYFPHHPQANGSTRWPVSIPAKEFRNELCYILVNQMAAFNSPVWFNVGTNMGRHREEQCSACFINSLDDDMKSILELGITEGVLYKGGSGSGVNYSALRSSRESLSGGGFASGPVPFIAKDDFNAGAIKSGGTTRRAAKMAILDVDHGDILEFIRCKKDSERAAQSLVDAGFDGDFRARWGAYALVPFQNANHSVRVTDKFMEAVQNNEDWNLMSRDGKTVLETVKAVDLWKEICEAAHFCGDPGLQFDTTINKWHTSPAHGRINGSNPCSEYMFLDDTACNLASINLIKFIREDGTFDIDAYRHTVDILITAMEIIVDAAGYPTSKIEFNSSKFRPLGLGYTNLGGYLMAQAIPYDSEEARAHAALLTSILTARAYARSAELADVKGPFEGYRDNASSMMNVMHQHHDALGDVQGVSSSEYTLDLAACAVTDWKRCIELGVKHGYRNAQASVLAPAGTISFLMDADTTGIEPELALAKVKKLVGGGTITILNTRVRDALLRLGYSNDDINTIGQYVVENGSLVGSLVKESHLAIFDTSFPDPIGNRSLRPEAHILMMAAVQPFVSGAISKTCNIPNTATENEISELYSLAWRTGLKAVALYRDGSKRTQPLDTKDKHTEIESTVAPEPLQLRKKLPNDCLAHRHKFSIGGHKGYIHVGLYPEDGKPGEVFIKMAKEGSTVAGLMDTIGILTSFCIQYGVPQQLMVEKLSYMNFEPSGITEHPSIRFAKSPVDYLFRYLNAEYGSDLHASEEGTEWVPEPEIAAVNGPVERNTGLTCHRCGNPAQRAGSCVTCPTCGQTSGCG